jgi:hypothetical protein
MIAEDGRKIVTLQPHDHDARDVRAGVVGGGGRRQRVFRVPSEPRGVVRHHLRPRQTATAETLQGRIWSFDIFQELGVDYLRNFFSRLKNYFSGIFSVHSTENVFFAQKMFE